LFIGAVWVRKSRIIASVLVVVIAVARADDCNVLTSSGPSPSTMSAWPVCRAVSRVLTSLTYLMVTLFAPGLPRQ
jgi:hypothetical protein